MVVLTVLLLALKLVQGGVHHTCGGGHDIVCTCPPPLSAGGGFEPPTKFFKRRGFDQGFCWEEGGDFYVKNKLKSEIFKYKKSLQTKMFFFIITKNLDWNILTKNLVLFKRWHAVTDEKF